MKVTGLRIAVLKFQFLVAGLDMPVVNLAFVVAASAGWATIDVEPDRIAAARFESEAEAGTIVELEFNVMLAAVAREDDRAAVPIAV